MNDIPVLMSGVNRDASSKDLGWYHQEIGNLLLKEMSEILQKYSKIPVHEIEPHIHKIRDASWEVAPFPCVGQFRFLSLYLFNHPSYSEVLQKIINGARFLDLGCCVGQEIRKLVFDGAPSDRIYGADLYQGFLDTGYDLFRDRDTLKSTFLQADVFDPQSGLSTIEGEMEIVFTGLFLHLFNWEQQKQIAIRIIKILAPRPGSLLVGSQAGSVEPGEKELRGPFVSDGRTHFLHDPESFEKLWREAAGETNTVWRVEASFSPTKSIVKSKDGYFGGNQDTRLLRFHVERLES